MLREVGQNNEGLRRVSDGVRSIGGPRECYLRNDGGECFELQRETLFISLEALTEPKFIDMEILKL